MTTPPATSPDAVRVRRCARDDAHALALVSQATHLETFAGIVPGADLIAFVTQSHGAAHYAHWLTRGDMALWLAEHPRTHAPIGYAVVGPIDPEGDLVGNASDLELKRIYVLTPHHGQGLGLRLLHLAIAHAKASGAPRLVLGMNAQASARAHEFYTRQGFVEIGQRLFTVQGVDYPNLVFALPL